MREQLKKDVEEISGQIVEWRRDFHRNPEVAFQEQRTSSVIRKYLESLDIPVTQSAGTGLRAVLKGNPGGKTVALRADIDALPLKEEGDKEYISQNPEAAHCCGHDGHMAILMGAVKLLSERRTEIRGNVVFLFQPSEERIPGGAKKMIEEGAIEGVDAIFGLHLWVPLPTGTMGVVKGPMMAQPDAFTIVVKGKGGHGSMPQQTVDPILVASQIVVNAQSIVSRNIDPLKPAVVSFGTIEGGTIYNIIPGEVKLTGTVRSFEPEIKDIAKKRIAEIAEGTAKAMGARVEFSYEDGYPPVVNDETMADFVLDVARQTLGKDKVVDIDPVMGGEDFAYFLEKIPGAFLFLGAGDGMNLPHHHPGFDIDEKVLPQGALLMT
ncbi:MAG: amidohydrolase, partial [Candidatus Aminicenantaceae bacterium]